MRISSYARIIFLAIGLSACAKGNGTPADGTSAGTFVLDPLSVKVSDLSTDPLFTTLSNSRLFQFTACVKDVGVLQPVVGATFDIFDGAKKIDTKTTDSTGCLYWSEKINFSQSESETYFEASRTFSAVTIHKGSVTVPLALDPWKKDGEALRDLRSQPTPATMRKLGTTESAPTGSLVIDTVGVQLDLKRASRNAASVALQLIFSPKIRRISLDGSPVVESIGDGRLHVRAQLFAQTQGNVTPVTDLFEISGVKVERGAAHGLTNLQLLTNLIPNTQLMLRFEAKAEGSQAYLQSAEGSVALGALSGVSNSFSGPLMPNSPVPFHTEAVTTKASAKEAGAEGEFQQELILSQASYKFEGRSFQIDSQLNLSTRRRYRFSFSPLVRNENGLPSQDVGNGHFVVKFLLETGGDITSSTVIDAQTVEADANAGLINLDVDFTIRDLRVLMGRLNVTIQVQPLGGLVNVPTKPYSDTINLLESGSLALLARPIAIEDRMALATIKSSEPPHLASELFFRSYKLASLNASELKATDATESDLADLVKGTPGSLAKMCGLFYGKGMISWLSNLESCKKNPKKFLARVATAHVRKLYSSHLSRPPESYTLSLASGVSASQGHNQSHSTSHSSSKTVDANVGLSAPGLSLAGVNIGIGASYGQTWGTADTTSSDRSSNSHRGTDIYKSLSVDAAEFNADADVDHCVVLSVLNTTSDDPKRYFYCSPQPERQRLHEVYYFVSESFANSALQDRNAPDQPFLALIRGADRYSAFAAAAANQNSGLTLYSDSPVPSEALKASENQFDGFFPGMLSAP